MKMRKSEKISAQFERALDFLNEAECSIQAIKEISPKDGEFLNNRFVELTSYIEELHMDTCCPLQMEEDERDEEIRVLERRLAELKAQG
jgi:polyhydroxyalkanoate synthesis regulator phasin